MLPLNFKWNCHCFLFSLSLAKYRNWVSKGRLKCVTTLFVTLRLSRHFDDNAITNFRHLFPKSRFTLILMRHRSNSKFVFPVACQIDLTITSVRNSHTQRDEHHPSTLRLCCASHCTNLHHNRVQANKLASRRSIDLFVRRDIFHRQWLRGKIDLILFYFFVRSEKKKKNRRTEF